MTPIQRREPSDFALEIDFVPDSTDPSRVFRTMTQLIDACQFMDEQLAAAIGKNVRAVLLLQDIRSGSLVTWLRSVVESLDEDALKSGDVKKLIGSYLAKGRRGIIGFLENRTTIQEAADIYDLQKVITIAAHETGLPIRQEPPVPARQIAESVKLISEATAPLQPRDGAKYITDEGETRINTGFRVTTEQIEEALTHETIINQDTMILKVKRPDFLGDSMWEFRHEGKKFPAKVMDVDWLRSFKSRQIVLQPGDAIRGTVEIETRYGQDQEVIATHYRILKVEQIEH
jgi:hypothetical protein